MDMENDENKFHHEHLYTQDERRDGNKKKNEMNDIFRMLDENIPDDAPKSNPHEPTREDDADAQFIAVETDEEFPEKKDLREN